MSRTYHHGDKAKQRSFGKNWDWMHEPGWWVREFMTRPQRAKTRQMLGRLSGLRNLEDAPIFPHPTKPHIYYW